MLVSFLSIARAEDPAPTEPPETIEIEAPEPLPSALDDLGTSAAEVALDGGLPDWVPLPGNLVRGKLFVRPLLGVEALAGQPPSARLGAAVGHRWWTLDPKLVSIGGEERLEVSAPIGAERGRRVELAVAAGPWIGPVGVRLGPTARWDRADWGAGVVLDDALLVGAGLDLSVRGGPVAATVGVEPAWVVVGERAPAGSLADELAWRAGAGWLGHPVELLADGVLRETAAGAIVEGGLSVHVHFL